MTQSPREQRLAISPASSCLRRLSWDCTFSAPLALPELCSALLAAGYVDESRAEWLRELRHALGHSVLLVPRTGRVQLRLHYLTNADDRAAVARGLADDLAAILRL